MDIIEALIPNQAQVASFARWLLTSLGIWLTHKGWIDNDTSMWIAGGSGALASLLWSIVSKTHAAIIKRAATIPNAQAKLREAIIEKTVAGAA